MINNINKMTIVFSADNNYAQFMGVAICSIFENKKDGYIIDVYVFDGGIKEDNKIKLRFLEEKYSFKIIYIKIDVTLFNDFYINKHISHAAYFRSMITELLLSIDKVLYLDCDLIVKGDISSLFEINIMDYYFAAVEDYFAENTRHTELNMPKNAKYFNSGV